VKLIKFISTSVLALLLVSTLLVFSHEFAVCTSEFSPSDLEVEILVTSPLDNGSYTSEVGLDVSLHFFAWSKAPNSSIIPYQDVTSLYQVDNGQLQNAPLYYASSQTCWRDIPNNGYWNEMRCNYTASLQGLSEGRHSLTISLEPSDITYYRVNPAGLAVPPQPSTGYFYVHQPTPTAQPTTEPTSVPLEFLVIIALAAIIATIASVLLLKRR
jgi:hypothetical protein